MIFYEMKAEMKISAFFMVSFHIMCYTPYDVNGYKNLFTMYGRKSHGKKVCLPF